MSAFDLARSLEKARRRLGEAAAGPTRSPRSDRGKLRLPPEVVARVARALGGRERPRTRDLLRRIEDDCRTRGLLPPSRATVYKLIDVLPTPTVRKADLPPSVRDALHNLEPGSEVPLHQVAFLAFNHGDLRAISFAAGMPWRALHVARRMRGHRRKSRGLIEAVARVRRI